MEKEGFYETRAALLERFGDVALIPLNEVAEYLNIDRRTLLRDGSFPVKKVGREWRVPVAPLTRWILS